MAVDCDGVLADFTTPVYAWLNAHYEGVFDVEKQWDFDILKSFDAIDAQPDLDAFCARPGFCASLPVLDGAHTFLRHLRDLADVVCVTSPYTAVPTWCSERVQWLERMGFEKQDVIFAKRKGLIRADILIDDHAKNVIEFGVDGCGILIDAPWNRGATNIVNRASSLFDALKIVERYLNRNSVRPA